MMRIRALTGLLALGIGASALWAQPTFTHLKSVEISSYFTTDGPQGDAVSDVAFDGRNLYVAGFSARNVPDPVPVGVLKIEKVLSPDVNQWNYVPLISLTQAAQSRVSYVVYKDGFLYLGTGLGDGSGDPSRTGVRKFDATTGIQNVYWNGTGVVMPADLTPGTTSRMECVALDPGYQGSGESLAILARGRGYVFRRDLTMGTAFDSMLCRPRRPSDNAIITTMRDVTFAPNGDVYLRLEEGIWYAQRTGASSVAGGDATRILDLPSVNYVLVNLLYLPMPTGDLLLANQRTNTPATSSIIRVYQVSGPNLTEYSQLNGAEPLPDGSTPDAFSFDIFNYTYGDGPDPSAGDVNLDGTVDDADLLAVLFAFGSSDPSADVNGDGTVDDADLLIVLFNFGSNPTARYLFVVNANTPQGRDRLDIYRVNP